MYCGMLLSKQCEYIAKVFDPGWSGIEQGLSWCISEEESRFYYWLYTESGWVCIQSYKNKFSIDSIASKFHHWDKEKINQFLNLIRDKRSEFLLPFSFALEDWNSSMSPKVFE